MPTLLQTLWQPSTLFMKDGNRRLKLERNIASMAMTDSDERIADAVDNIDVPKIAELYQD